MDPCAAPETALPLLASEKRRRRKARGGSSTA
jgi:hypothetical protein